MNVVFHALFDVDADNSKEWYEDQQPGLADAFELELARCVMTLIERPLSFRIVRGNMRRAPMKRFPHLVVFELDGDNLYIAGVFHASQDQSRWDRRTGRPAT